MPNKLFSATLLLVGTIFATTVVAQDKPATQPTSLVQAEKTEPKRLPLPLIKTATTDAPKTVATPKADIKTTVPKAGTKSPAPTSPTQPNAIAKVQSAPTALKPATPVSQPKMPMPSLKGMNNPLTMAKKSPAEIQAENKRRMEEELKNTTTVGKSIVNFPNRPSLGTMELAPLPTINESAITGPTPMAQSVSAKDLPSEQLLGRITPEVFQEMADLERGNTFLKLQLEKEKLKNDLEKLKSTYREKRLEEIAKRENVVRTRIQWWQEQEKVRLAIEKKQKEEEALNKKLAEEEATRNRIREEALNRMRMNQQVAQPQKKDEKKTAAPIVEKLPEPMENMYAIDSIRGIGSDLTAKLKSKSDNSIVNVKRNDILPTGHVVKEVKSDSVLFAFGNRMDQLIFRPVNK